METEKYFTTAIVCGAVCVGLFFFLIQSGISSRSIFYVFLESVAISALCLTIAFGLGGALKKIAKGKREVK